MASQADGTWMNIIRTVSPCRASSGTVKVRYRPSANAQVVATPSTGAAIREKALNDLGLVRKETIPAV
jgi:hypothetical protein